MNSNKPGSEPEQGPFFPPFEALGKLKKEDSRKTQAQRQNSPPPPPLKKSPDTEEEDSLLFKRAMSDVTPISSRGPDRVESPPPPLPSSRANSEQSEVIAALSDLVAGKGEFSLKDTPEYMEGIAPGIDPRLAWRLHNGDYSVQRHLDLHGFTVEEAHKAVLSLFDEAVRSGYRCLLLVHGRGLNSPDGRAVLKEQVKLWLSRGRLARHVLAFATARPCDGGSGAVYVLLRKSRFHQSKSR